MARILYVDDEDDIREIAAMALGLDPSLDVRTCGSGAEGVALAQAWRPDLVMLDFMMPTMDGPATLERLRAGAETASIPVVFITARTQNHQVAEMIAMGAAGVIPKPFDPISLAREVRKHLDAAGR